MRLLWSIDHRCAPQTGRSIQNIRPPTEVAGMVRKIAAEVGGMIEAGTMWSK